jgi:endogenous inhibitor of DNA gyrase (YacG/DUF329 family)
MIKCKKCGDNIDFPVIYGNPNQIYFFCCTRCLFYWLQKLGWDLNE